MTENLWRVPADVDVVVSIPRSGLIPATIIALSRNLPMTDVKGLLEGRIISSGQTRQFRTVPPTLEQFRHALIVDDSVLSGASLEKVKRTIRAANLPFRVSYAAVYVTGKAAELVDLHFEICPLPRLFEWNYLHHAFLSNACVGLEGVLCVAPTAAEAADPVAFETYVQEAAPQILPTCRIRHLVTSRPERYRRATEQWLRRHGVSYDRLTFLPSPPAAPPDMFKARVYREDRGALIFIEADPQQSAAIARRAGKPVICVREQRLYRPEALALVTLENRANTFSRRLVRRCRQMLGGHVDPEPELSSKMVLSPVATPVQVSSSKVSAAAKAGMRPAATASSTPVKAALTRGEA